jgi:hypothetical protein
MEIPRLSRLARLIFVCLGLWYDIIRRVGILATIESWPIFLSIVPEQGTARSRIPWREPDIAAFTFSLILKLQ